MAAITNLIYVFLDAFLERKGLKLDMPEGWQSSEHLQEGNGEKLAYERLK